MSAPSSLRSLLVICLLVTLFSAGTRGHPQTVEGGCNLPSCTNQCVNRYGECVCCDEVPLNGGLMCPPTPRLDMDCTDVKMEVKSCTSDATCGAQQKCCTDSCAPFGLICMPGERNINYLMP